MKVNDDFRIDNISYKYQPQPHRLVGLRFSHHERERERNGEPEVRANLDERRERRGAVEAIGGEPIEAEEAQVYQASRR